MIEFRVTQGRLLFRSNAQHQIAMVGVLHLLRQDPRLNRIRSWGAPDPAYLSYLPALDQANGIEVERPRTVEEHRSRTALAARCIREAGRMRN